MGGSAARKPLTDGVPPGVQAAVTEAERDIARLALEADRIQQRIAKLQAFIEGCRIFEGVEETVTGTYAEAATSLLAAARRPMTTGELVDAMAAAGRPVGGPTRKHRMVTLAISLKREQSLKRTSKGFWLRGVPIPTGNTHGS
jgi:hypothetical protein